MHSDRTVVKGMAEMIFPKPDIDITLTAALRVLLKFFGHIMKVAGKGLHQVALPGQDHLGPLDHVVAGVQALGAVDRNRQGRLVPGGLTLLMLLVKVEINPPLMPLGEGPRVSHLGQRIHNGTGHRKPLHKAVQFFPVAVNSYMDNRRLISLTPGDHHMDVAALIDPHITRPGVLISDPRIRTKGKNFLNGEAVLSFDVSKPQVQVVEIRQRPGRAKLSKQLRWLDISRMQL